MTPTWVSPEKEAVRCFPPDTRPWCALPLWEAKLSLMNTISILLINNWRNQRLNTTHQGHFAFLGSHSEMYLIRVWDVDRCTDTILSEINVNHCLSIIGPCFDVTIPVLRLSWLLISDRCVPSVLQGPSLFSVHCTQCCPLLLSWSPPGHGGWRTCCLCRWLLPDPAGNTVLSLVHASHAKLQDFDCTFTPLSWPRAELVKTKTIIQSDEVHFILMHKITYILIFWE